MSGTIDTGGADLPTQDCGPGYRRVPKKGGVGWECVKDVHVEPWMLIWQGDCDGWLVVRLSHAPAVNPAEAGRPPVMRSGPPMAPPLAKLGKRIAGDEVALQTLGKRVNRGELTALLKKVLEDRVAPVAGSAKRSKKAARPKARSARRKK